MAAAAEVLGRNTNSSNSPNRSEITRETNPDVLVSKSSSKDRAPTIENTIHEGSTSMTLVKEKAHLYANMMADYGELDDTDQDSPPEFEKFWKATQENPLDFNAWIDLLQFIEHEGHMPSARKAFNAFFIRYPYCYGYWKKYVDLERRSGFCSKAEEVCLQALQMFPLSLDLWIHYINFLRETLNMNLKESTEKIRSAFESATLAAGTDFRSDRLWEMYVNWEKEQGNLKAVTAIYDRLLRIPTQLYSSHFERFKEHVASHPPRKILSIEEFLRLRTQVVSTHTTSKTEEVQDGSLPEDAPPGIDSTAKDFAEQEQKVRELLIAERQAVFQNNEIEVSKRWNFEEAIKRPYFHVKPLDRAQLRNWQNYLDFEIANGSHERVIVLFERCMIACTLYEDFWCKYTKYMEKLSEEGTRNVFQRACEVHLPRRPNIHLLWATFEEQHGNRQEARRILENLEQLVPGLAMVRLRRASLERRAGNMEAAESLLREAVQYSQGTPLHAFYSIKLARQLLRVQKNLGRARKVLLDAIEKEPENGKLHMNLLELEFSADVRQNEGNILQCINGALSSNLPPEMRKIFSQRRLEFHENFGTTIQRDSAESEEKKAKTEDGLAVTHSVMSPSVCATTGMSSMPNSMTGDVMNNQNSYNYSAWYQQHYGSYGYPSTWNYNQYYSSS
ncbi:PRP39 factor, partial [Polypterus senegalus]|nr:PRP39 factor [Polypterus senegalus]